MATISNISFPIKNADGTSFHDLVMHRVAVESVIMSLGDKITGDVYYKDNTLAVTMQEYVEYNGVRFILVNPPTVVREGMTSDNSELKGMTKYSFVFYHPMCLIGNIPFTDVAVTSNEEQYLSQNKTFNWIGNLFDMVAKLNKNLQGTQWVVATNIEHYEQDGITETASWQKAAKIPDEPLSFDKSYVSDVLKTSYETWDIPFTIDQIASTDERYAQGKRFLILFGMPSNEILDEHGEPYIFQFGRGVGLKNNSRTPKNNKIITRIAGQGAERNIPYGYPQIPWYGDQTWNYTINNESGTHEITLPNGDTVLATSYPIYNGIVGGRSVRLIKHPFTRKNLMPSVYSTTVFNKVSPYNSDGSVNQNYNPDTPIVDYYDADGSYPNPIVPSSPSFESHEFEDIYPQLGEERLVSVSPYDDTHADAITYNDFMDIIDDLIADAINEHERSYLESVKDVIQNQRKHYGSISSSGGSYTFKISYSYDEYTITVEYTSDHANFKYMVIDNGVTIPVTWDDTMNDDGEYEQSYFKVKLPTLGFDIYACASITEEMKINMRSGACIGCTFPIQVDWDDYKKNFFLPDGTFDPAIHTTAGDGHVRDGQKYPDSSQGQINVVVQKDTETFGTLMPNVYQQPQTNDEFVILGISMPKSYITTAEEKLDSAMYEYMLENNVHYYEYPLKFSEHFLATHSNIVSQIHNNTKVNFQYAGAVESLFVKSIVVKYEENVLPKYEITLVDDIEIVLNQIGQVTDDVSRMRVQVSELQKYYSENIIQAINEKLSKVVDDVCQGRITFQQGLDSIGSAIFYGELRSPDFTSGLYTGHGWRVDQLGNAELESLRVRTFFEVVELIINRMQAQEGDTMFTDNDQIDKVDKVVEGGVTSYILSLKEKWSGYVTAQKVDNILKGIVNTLAAKGAGVSDESGNNPDKQGKDDGDNKYYTSWMRVINTQSTKGSLGANQIEVVLYGDSDVPANKNFEPCELMTIARWGCSADPDEVGITEAEKQSRIRRARLFMISTSDGRVVKYTGVNSPKLENFNYGVTIGELPDFVKRYSKVSSILAQVGEHTDWLYAQGVVVGNFIKVDVEGVPEVSIIDCGAWVDGSLVQDPSPRNGIYYNGEWNSDKQQFETHDVWHNNAKWRCLQHQPVVIGGITTYYEPTDNNYAYWQKLEQAVDGVNGTIYQRMYKSTNSSTIAWNNDTKPTGYPTDTHGWSATPSAVSSSLRYRWVTERRSNDGGETWEDGGWSLPVIDTYLAEDGTSISVKGHATGHYATWSDCSDGWVDGMSLIDDGSDNPFYTLGVCVCAGDPHDSDPPNWITPTNGDGYIINGYLWIAGTNGWTNVGQIKGDKGDDGENAVLVTLDNEHEDFLYDDAGQRVSAAVTSQARLYDGGAEKTSQATWSISARSGVTAAASTISASGLLTVTGITSQTASVTVRAEYPANSGKFYYAKFTANKTNQDKYELVLSPNSIPCNLSSYETVTVNISARRLDLQGNQTDIGFGAYTNPSKISTSSSRGYLRLFCAWVTGGTVGTKTSQFTNTFHVSLSDAVDHDGVYFELRKYDSPTASNDSDYKIVDYETVPILKVVNGTSPWVADLDNEMDSIAFQSNGELAETQEVSTNVNLYYGSQKKQFTIQVFKDSSLSPEYEYDNGVADVGVTVSWNTGQQENNTVTVEFSQGNVTYFTDGKILFYIQLTSVDDANIKRILVFTVNGIKAAANGISPSIYNLLPSPSQVNIGRTDAGAYSPSVSQVICGYTKKQGTQVTTTANATSAFDGYYIYFRRRERSTQVFEGGYIAYNGVNQNQNYYNNARQLLESLDVATYDAVEFYISATTTTVNRQIDGKQVYYIASLSSYIDKETVVVVSDGQKGQKGENSAVLELSRSSILYNSLSNGRATSQQDFVVNFRLVVDGNNCSISSADNVSVNVNGIQGISVVGKMTGSVTLRVASNNSPSGVVTIQVTGTHEGKEYTASAGVTIESARQGEQGVRGKVGRFFYFAGTFNQNDSTQTFIVNDAQAPYFEHTENGQKLYHVFNYDVNGSYTMAEMWAISSNWNQAPWDVMTNDFKYLITEALFTNYAHFGGAIINGDWEMSVYGVLYDASNNATNISSDEAYVIIDDVRYDHNNAYTKFDPTSPNKEKVGVINFVPNYSVDLKRGWSYQNVAEVNGVFRSQQSDGRSTYIGAASLLFGYQNNDIFRISCEGSGTSRNVKMQIGAGDSGMTHFEIESRGTFQGQETSLIRLQNNESGVNPRSIVIHKGGIAMTNSDGSAVVKSKSWEDLLS